MTPFKLILLNRYWLFLLVLGINSVYAQTSQEVANKAFGSTVLLVMEDANGHPLSLGSGFFVRPGQIASNLHVVDGAERGYVKLINEKNKYDIKCITAIDPHYDLVVLKTANGTDEITSPVISAEKQKDQQAQQVKSPPAEPGAYFC